MHCIVKSHLISRTNVDYFTNAPSDSFTLLVLEEEELVKDYRAHPPRRLRWEFTGDG